MRIEENLNRSFTVASQLIHILIHKSLIFNILQLKTLDSGKVQRKIFSFLREYDL